jgi:hypothetical protein
MALVSTASITKNGPIHQHSLQQVNDLAMWVCDGFKLPGGCSDIYSTQAQLFPASQSRWRCNECNFDLCKSCSLFYGVQSQNNNCASSSATPEERQQQKKELLEYTHSQPDSHPLPCDQQAPCEPLIERGEYELVYKYEYCFDTEKWKQSVMVIHLEAIPFAHGVCRNAYHMLDLGSPERENTYVAKASKTSCAKVVYFDDVRMQAVCQHFADAYNSRHVPKKVKFLPAFVIERFRQADKPLMACEPFVEGSYIKYNNNDGWVNDVDRNTPQAFTHFTFVHSKSDIMIVDIQGVGDVFTDPQIHTVDGDGFGQGNQGPTGFQKFFTSHHCNSICEGLGLEHPDPGNTPSVGGTVMIVRL